MKVNRGLILASFGIGLFAACGGSTQGTPDGGQDAGASGSSSGTGSSSGAASSSGSGSGGSSGSSGGSSGGGASIIPAGATPGAGMVTCGTATCNAPQVCCSGGGGGPMCSTITACNSGGNDSYTCTGQANCMAPQICCVTYAMGRGANDVSACQASCGMGNTAQVCQTAMECPAGMTCGNGGAQGISVCQPPLIPPGTSQGTGAITCGTATCNAPDVCCSGGGGGGGGGNLMCSALTACDNNGNDSYTCTGQANCAAPNICCVTYANGAQQNDIARCQASVAFLASGQWCGMANTDQVCQTNAECIGGMVCRGGGNAPGGITTCLPPTMMNPDAGTGSTGMDAAVDHAPAPEAGAADAGADAASGGG
jgi:hypothetical protein